MVAKVSAFSHPTSLMDSPRIRQYFLVLHILFPVVSLSITGSEYTYDGHEYRLWMPPREVDTNTLSRLEASTLTAVSTTFRIAFSFCDLSSCFCADCSANASCNDRSVILAAFRRLEIANTSTAIENVANIPMSTVHRDAHHIVAQIKQEREC